MTTSPIVSVLMTVRNGEKYVAETIRSVLAQDMPDFEYVIVDDGSTDSTPRILKEYEAKDKRITVVVQEPRGIAASANNGLSRCRGEFVARIDADDLAKPQRFRRQLAYLAQTGHVCVGSYVEYIDPDGRLLTTIKPPVENEKIQELILRGHGAIYNPSSMIRREALERIGGYISEYDTAEDLDCWLRLGEIGTLGNVPEALLQYRLHPKSASATQREVQRARARLACERAWQRRGIAGTFEAAEPWRPGRDRASRHEFMLRYGWWAFGSGEKRTAILYARRAIALQPWKPAGWKLLGVASLKSPRKRP